jgi:hypothetical protein
MKKHPPCECHKKIDGRVTCLLTCMKCSGAKEVRTVTRKGYKKIEVIFH